MSAPSRTVALAPNSPGAIVTKWIICSMLGGDSPTEAADIARDQCRGLPHLEHAFRQKAAVGAQGLSGTIPMWARSGLARWRRTCSASSRRSSVSSRSAPRIRWKPRPDRAPRGSARGSRFRV